MKTVIPVINDFVVARNVIEEILNRIRKTINTRWLIIQVIMRNNAQCNDFVDNNVKQGNINQDFNQIFSFILVCA